MRALTTAELSAAESEAIRGLLQAAFGRADGADEDSGGGEGFTEDDWRHALGGRHFVLEIDGSLAAHAAVVPRELQVAGRPLRTGYVEAVAVAPVRQNLGLGSRLMTRVTEYVRDGFELGALATGRPTFYGRLGWRTWLGPTSVRTPSGERRTPQDDGVILVLATPASPPLDFGAPISCDWRAGDVW